MLQSAHRSVENQQHRLVASGIDVPVGMEEPTSGALSVMLNAVHAAQHGHEFICRSWEVKHRATWLTHTILRGAVNKHDQCLPNYHYEDLKLLLDLCNERDPGRILPVSSMQTTPTQQKIHGADPYRHEVSTPPSPDDIRNFVKGAS